jgi:anti-sigma regulatory factor (Ser/Thr protein kinase)
LPSTFPVKRGIEISAHYRPGSTEADIGGDWYDAFETESGDLVVTIGDVTGKGIEAARLMVLMRQAIRVAALISPEPRTIAQTCNRLLLSESENRLASAFIGVLDPQTRVLRYVSAGHAPPLLRLPGYQVRRLESPSLPLGAFLDAPFETHEVYCEDRSMLVLYTDGLIEISRDVIAGDRTLEEVVRSDAVAHAANAAEFIERAIADEAPRDDIAILVVNFGEREMRWQFEAADARAAYTMRDEFFRCLRKVCSPTEDELCTCGLIFAELIGNAVRHAPGPLSVSLEFRQDDAVLHVIDKGPGFRYDPALPENLWDEGGRGLFLVSNLARNVHVEQLPGLGSHVIVTLPIRCESGTRAA